MNKSSSANFISVLGRQPELGRAELASLLGAENVSSITDGVVQFRTPDNQPLNINRLGGSKKLGAIVREATNPSKIDTLHIAYRTLLDHISGVVKAENAKKTTLGISAINSPVLAVGDLQKLGLKVKSACKKQGVSLRLLPNQTPELSTATSHHNKLGLKPSAVELLIIGAHKSTFFALSTGAQNITAYSARDQQRPARDARVGMLPPKLAQIIINLASGQQSQKNMRLLDPFCGTGVILQEAALMGYKAYGTDLEPRMIDYSRRNLDFIAAKMRHKPDIALEPGDATKTRWQPPVDLVATETYLGQPFSAPPSTVKLREVKHTCESILRAFLKNLASQIKPGTRLCLAIPAWRLAQISNPQPGAHFSRINPLDLFATGEYNVEKYGQNGLLYYREDQIVARDLLVLIKK